MDAQQILQINGALEAKYSRLQQLLAGVELLDSEGLADALAALDRPVTVEEFTELQRRCLQDTLIEIVHDLGKMLQATGLKGKSQQKIPVGLLKRYGIKPRKDWTPAQAWSALTAAGCDIGQVYRELRDKRRAEAKDERH